MARLIDADELFDTLAKRWGIPKDWDGRIEQTCEDAFGEIENAPTVDAAPVVHGQWEKHPNMYGFVRCSECRDCVVWDEWVNNEKWKYCPNCGAKMDGA